MTAETRRVAADSTLVGLVCATADQLRAWLAASWLTSASAALADDLATVIDASWLAGAVRTLTRWIRRSFLYRWLTKEPDPDVIVIDLRDTYTVGPFVALLDRLAPTIERTWRGSFVHRVADRFTIDPNRELIADSKTLRLLVAALEPPELPDEDRRE